LNFLSTKSEKDGQALLCLSFLFPGSSFKFRPYRYHKLFIAEVMLAFLWAAGEGVVDDGAIHRAGCHLPDFIPFGPGEADSDQSLVAGKDNAAVLVIPGIGFLLPHHQKLDPVNGFEFFQSQPQGLGCQRTSISTKA